MLSDLDVILRLRAQGDQEPGISWHFQVVGDRSRFFPEQRTDVLVSRREIRVVIVKPRVSRMDHDRSVVEVACKIANQWHSPGSEIHLDRTRWIWADVEGRVHHSPRGRGGSRGHVSDGRTEEGCEQEIRLPLL
jgi:hypothetical protein